MYAKSEKKLAYLIGTSKNSALHVYIRFKRKVFEENSCPRLRSNLRDILYNWVPCSKYSSYVYCVTWHVVIGLDCLHSQPIWRRKRKKLQLFNLTCTCFPTRNVGSRHFINSENSFSLIVIQPCSKNSLFLFLIFIHLRISELYRFTVPCCSELDQPLKTDKKTLAYSKSLCF